MSYNNANWAICLLVAGEPYNLFSYLCSWPVLHLHLTHFNTSSMDPMWLILFLLELLNFCPSAWSQNSQPDGNWSQQQLLVSNCVQWAARPSAQQTAVSHYQQMAFHQVGVSYCFPWEFVIPWAIPVHCFRLAG